MHLYLNQNAAIKLHFNLIVLVTDGIGHYCNLEFKVPIPNIPVDSCDAEKSHLFGFST